MSNSAIELAHHGFSATCSTSLVRLVVSEWSVNVHPITLSMATGCSLMEHHRSDLLYHSTVDHTSIYGRLHR